MAERRCCIECCQSVHPPVEAQQPLYDEICQEVDNNIISIKVPKNARQVQGLQGGTGNNSRPPINVTCTDAYGKECKPGCVKVNIIPDKLPPPKEPEEEMLLLRTTKRIVNTDEVKNSLEIEFKAPRNYVPLPDPGPPPPIIEIVSKNDDKKPKKGKGKGK